MKIESGERGVAADEVGVGGRGVVGCADGGDIDKQWVRQRCPRSHFLAAHFPAITKHGPQCLAVGPCGGLIVLLGGGGQRAHVLGVAVVEVGRAPIVEDRCLRMRGECNKVAGHEAVVELERAAVPAYEARTKFCPAVSVDGTVEEAVCDGHRTAAGVGDEAAVVTPVVRTVGALDGAFHH